MLILMCTMRINLNELRAVILEALKSAYEVLGLRPGASDDEIKAAWKKLALQNHPDRGGSHGKMVDINNAKDRLLDKTQLFRFGDKIKGYEAPGAAAEPAKPASPNADARAREQAYWDDMQRRQREKDAQARQAREQEERARAQRDREEQARRSAGQSAWDSKWDPNTGRKTSDSTGAPKTDSANPMGTRYFIYQSGTSNKFWQIHRAGSTLYVYYGRVGSKGKQVIHNENDPGDAMFKMRELIRSKLNKGYRASTYWETRGQRAPDPSPFGTNPSEPRGQNPAPAPGAGRGFDEEPKAGDETEGYPKWQSAKKEPHRHGGQQTAAAGKEYKVYPYKGQRRVVRVGGKLYGTDTGGRLKTGGQTKFQANDRARTTPVNGKMKVTKSHNGADHSQTWDPIDEVRQIVDDIIIESIVKIALS